MEDKEIIKALECCARPIHCGDCPYMGHNPCRGELITDTFNLVNRQKAEIERVQNDYLSMQSTLAKMTIGVEQARTEAIKEFAERLKEEPIHMALPLLGLQTKSEIEDYFDDILSQIGYSIDNLVKEMTD